MINDHVYGCLKSKGFEDRITEHSETIDTVEHAAQQIGCSEAEIAKTLSFIVDGNSHPSVSPGVPPFQFITDVRISYPVLQAPLIYPGHKQV